MSIKREIDFFEQVRADPEITGRSVKRIPIAFPFCAALLAVLICWGIFSWLDFDTKRRLSAISEDITGTANPGGISDANGAEDMLHIELEYKDTNRLTSGRLKEIFALQPDDLNVLGVTYYDNRITIDCWSKRELCGADFAKLLRGKSNSFYDVNYTGVTALDDGYSFVISFYCAGEVY